MDTVDTEVNPSSDDDIETLNEEAASCLKKHKFKEAKQLLKKGVEQNNSSSLVYYAMANLGLYEYYKEPISFKDDFLPYLKKAIDIDYNIGAFVGLALYYSYQEMNAEETMKYWRLALMNRYVPALLVKAKHHREQKEYNQMKEYYLMTLDVGHVDGLRELIDFHMEKGDIAESIYYTKMLENIKKNN